MKTAELNATDIFDELGPLEEHEQKKFKVERSPILDAFVRGLETIIDNFPDNWYVNRHVEKLCEEFPLPKYDARDVEAFSLMLSSEDYKTAIFEYETGLWLNALIQRCPDEKITIRTHHPSDLLIDIGASHESKYLIVNGDVGFQCGRDMKSGIIRVKGNVGTDAGMRMEGGKIIVEGNARDAIGWYMEGGIIHVKGDVGIDVGAAMEGGEIYLNGSYKSLGGRISGGDIYHKGKCIVKDGKIL